MFCPSPVDGGIFIKTAITCSQTGGIMVGVKGVMKAWLVSGGLAGVGGGGGGGGVVEASGAAGEPEGCHALGAVDMVWCGS